MSGNANHKEDLYGIQVDTLVALTEALSVDASIMPRSRTFSREVASPQA